MPPHRLLTVVRVIESAEADSITGKFETKAQILAKRHQRWLLASKYYGTQEVYKQDVLF